MDWTSKPDYAKWGMVNFLVLTIFGSVLRYMQVFNLPLVNYQFLLHAHSHFAFAGWMFFAIALLISHQITGGQYPTSFRYVFIATVVSAYGMLVSFYLQGYKPVSIIFSTLFVFITYRFTYLVFKSGALKKAVNDTGYRLISGALIFVCLSSLGPFALGPLIALGFKNTALYQDAIYFYLHFQMNGFMFLAALGLLASATLINPLPVKAKMWLNLFIYSAVPLYFIFTLWSKPNICISIAAALGAVLNMVSWLILCVYLRKLARQLSFLAKAALIAATLKIIFQVLVCFPPIGQWAFLSRNLIVGYIHLLTLAIIVPLIIDQFIKKGFLNTGNILNTVNWFYIITVIIYLALLFLQPLLSLFSIALPYYQFVLLFLCLLFLPAGSYWLISVKKPSHFNKPFEL